MSLDYLEELTTQIDNGQDLYACPGQQTNEWIIGSSVEELRAKARRTANARRFEAGIYKLVNKMDTTSSDSYLICKKILEPGPRGEPHLLWSLVDTREAAELLRDVSQGPSPYFGAIIQEKILPT